MKYGPKITIAAVHDSDSKVDSCRELNLARVLRACDDAEVGRAERSPGRLKIRPIEDVEGFGPNLKPGVLGEVEVALQRQVGREIAGRPQVRERARRVPEGIRRRLRESRGV